jgi:HAE1 family hydrophobic/amphiphilic exporter-1
VSGSKPLDVGLTERLTAFSLRRRVTVLVLLVTVGVVGTVATLGIPIELFPSGWDSPYLRVYVPWADSPPREVLDKITEPLEEELSTVQGLANVSSRSILGSARVGLEFKQGTDMDLAYREVRDRVERARREFPTDVDRVFIYKNDISGIPIYVLGVAVDPSVADPYNLIQKRIILPLERLEGVASVEANGLEEKEILIELDRERTEASGLNIWQLAQSLGQDSFTMASGHVYEGQQKLLLRSVAQYGSVDELRNRPVSANVRLGDIATIRYAEPEKRYRVRAMSRPAYAIVVFKEGEANVRDVSARVARLVDDMDDDPQLSGVESIEIFNQGSVIDEQLRNLLKSGVIGGFIAALVLFFFLRRFRVTLVASLAIPLSMLVALTVMFFAGETLNLLSLLALMVCVGLLVDNSVVVAENIDRVHRAGLDRTEAAIRGAGEIALAITMSTLTTIIVFLPVSLVEGQMQFILLRMSIPIAIALAASLVIALVYVPLGIYMTLPPRAGMPVADRGRSRVGRTFRDGLGKAYEWSFGSLSRFYNVLLAHSLGRRLETVLVLVALGALTAFAMQKRGLTVVDVQEEEQQGFDINVRMPSHYTLEETEEWFLKAEHVVETHADELGLDGWFLFHTKTRGELQGWFSTPRTTNLTAKEVTEKVVAMLPERAGMELITGQEKDTAEQSEGSIWRARLVGEDPDELEETASKLEDFFLGVDGVLGVRRDDTESPNELGVVVDRDRTQRYGIDPQVVAGVVGYALRGQGLPRYHDKGKEIPVRIRYQKSDRESLEALSSFLVPTASGDFVPLSAVTEARMLKTPDAIYRENKQISRRIALDLRAEGAKDTMRRLDALKNGIDLPEGIRFARGDEIRNSFNDDLKAMRFALFTSILFIYLLMGLLFESFILPLSIIFTIPLAAFGVIWAHLLKGIDIDFLGAVGIVLLIGVVVNNGIVLIDTVNRLRQEGHSRRDAILKAASRRFRPIMMTAITTIGGLLPLAFAGRMDSGISYTSFSYTLIGGMTTATMLTLLVVPIFYTFFDDLRNTVSALLGTIRPRRKEPSVPPAEPGNA